MSLEYKGKFYDENTFKEVPLAQAGIARGIPTTSTSYEPRSYGTVQNSLKTMASASGLSEDYITNFLTSIGEIKPPTTQGQFVDAWAQSGGLNPNNTANNVLPKQSLVEIASLPQNIQNNLSGLTGGNKTYAGLTDTQVNELNAAALRIQQGTGSSTDKANVKYAGTKYGYTAPQMATLTGPSGEKKVVAVGSPEASNLLSSGWVLGTKPNTVITADNLQQGATSPVNIQGGTPSVTGTASATAAGTQAVKTVEDYMAEAKKQLDAMKSTQAATEAANLTTTINQILEKTKGKSAMLAAKLAEPGGADEMTRELTGIKSKIKTLQAEQQAFNTSIDGKPITLAQQFGAKAQKNAEYNAQILTLTAQQSALLGNIADAKDTAQKSIDAKYDPYYEELAIKQTQLTNLKNSGILDKEATVYANALERMYADQKQALADKKTEETNIKNIWADAVKAGITDQTILNQISNASSLQSAMSIYSNNLPKEATWSAPYLLGGDYVQKNNRTGEIRTAVNMPAGNDSLTGMTAGQISTFNSIVSKYNSSPLIAASDRTVVLKNAINQIKNNPNNGTLQLNLVYSYIQALDTYQSAVREGELGLVNSIDSKVGKLGNYVEQIKNGQVVRPEVAQQIAEAAQALVDTISEGAKRKAKSFESQANVSGVGDAWKQYIGGFEQNYSQTESNLTNSVNEAIKQGYTPIQVYQYLRTVPEYIPQIQEAEKSGYTPEQIVDYLKKKSNSVSMSNTAQKLAAAIMQVESGGKQVSGASGEFGKFQFMPDTWKTISSQYNKEVNGKTGVLPQTSITEEKVAQWKIEKLLAQGNTPKEVALIWNTSLGGSEKPLVKKGVNSMGIAYDSNAYADKVLNTLYKLG